MMNCDRLSFRVHRDKERFFTSRIPFSEIDAAYNDPVKREELEWKFQSMFPEGIGIEKSYFDDNRVCYITSLYFGPYLYTYHVILLPDSAIHIWATPTGNYLLMNIYSLYQQREGSYIWGWYDTQEKPKRLWKPPAICLWKDDCDDCPRRGTDYCASQTVADYNQCVNYGDYL